jgi:hypothetical protein
MRVQAYVSGDRTFGRAETLVEVLVYEKQLRRKMCDEELQLRGYPVLMQYENDIPRSPNNEGYVSSRFLDYGEGDLLTAVDSCCKYIRKVTLSRELKKNGLSYDDLSMNDKRRCDDFRNEFNFPHDAEILASTLSQERDVRIQILSAYLALAGFALKDLYVYSYASLDMYVSDK